MKNRVRISLILAALLFVAGLSACGENRTADTQTSSVQQTIADRTTVQEDTEATQQAQTKAESTRPAAQAAEEEEDDPEEELTMFVYGTWNDGKEIEYTFNTDGTGTRKNVTANTTESLRFEVNEKRAKIVFRVGEKGKKETAKYAVRDDTHMTLTFSAKEVVSLEYGVLLTKDTVPFSMGVWETGDDTQYIFRMDGSGAVRDTQTGTGVSFQYEVEPGSSLIIFHMGSADDVTPAVYTLQSKTKMVISFDGGAVALTWKGKEE